MISVKSFVIDRAVDFIMILEGLSQTDSVTIQTNTVFTSSFPGFQYDIIDMIGYRKFCFVYMSCINYFCQCLYFLIWTVCVKVSFS